VELAGSAEEETVGQGATDVVVEKDEHQGDADTFIGQMVGLGLSLRVCAQQAAEKTSEHVILSGAKDLLFVCFQ